MNLTNADGEVTKTYKYDAFGVEKDISDSDTNAFRYCGEYYDAETGTIYLRARYYDPEIGRFISRDTVTGDNIDPLSLNLYTYCLNNPLHFVDENGHRPSLSKIVKAAAIVAVAAVAVTAIVATAGAAGAAVGVAAGMYLGVSSATAVTISTAVTFGAYAVAGGIGATALSDAGEELTGTNVIRDKLMGGNQDLYDTVEAGLYTVGAGYMTLGADNYGLSGGRQSTSTTPQKSSTNTSGYSKNGYNPKPGERTLNGYVKSVVEPGEEISLRTNSAGFNNNNGNVGGVFKRFGNGSHGGVSPHVHQPSVNIAPNGSVYGRVGSKTANGGVTYPTPKDVKQLYDYKVNKKYR